MSEFKPKDAAIRARVEDEAQTLFAVEAGAGTGKTSLLVSRYVQLIEKHGISPTRIVAITFTEKAAGELKERVRTELLRRKSSAVADLDRAAISTIHAFAASLLRERPIEAGIDPNFEQLDEIGSQMFLDDGYDRFFQVALPENPRAVTRALAFGISLSRIRELAFLLYGNRDLLDGLSFTGKPVDINPFFRDLVTESESLWGLASSHCVDTQDEGYRAIESLFRELQHLKNAPQDTRERALLLRINVAAKGNQKAWADPRFAKEQKARMKDLAEGLRQVQGALRTEVFTDLLGFLQGFVDFIRVEKQREGKLDFDDLLLLARDLLRTHPDVAKNFGDRFQHILVDEFQDTDPVQTELIWRLASETSKGDQWNDFKLRDGRLFVVGDPKQSIYRFRRASVEVYEAATKHLAESGERVFIQQNFRSSPAIIDWVNRVFPNVLEAGSYSPLIADSRHLAAKESFPVQVLEPPEFAVEPRSREMRSLEAEAIAAFLARTLDSSDPIVFDKNDKTLRRPRLDDIAVLFSTTTDIDLYEEMLRKYGLPFSLEGGHLFYGRAEVHAVIVALEAILHPADPISVVAALRSILFALSDQDLVEIRRRGVSLDYRQAEIPEAWEPVHTAYRILRELHAVAFDLSASELLERLFLATRAIPLTLLRFHGEQAAANLEKLISLARAIEQDRMLAPDEFLQWIRTRADEQDQQAESPLAQTDSQHIRLMTVHKAKGLEFPIVILANLASQIQKTEPVIADRLNRKLAVGIGSKEARFSTPNYESLLTLEKDQKVAECRRLLYVAATRARDRLVLPRFVPARTEGNSLWSLLKSGWDAGLPQVETVPFSTLPIREERVALSNPDAGTAPSWSISQSLAEAHEVRGRRESWTRGLSLRTPTSLVDHGSFEGSVPFTGGRSSALALGSALHLALEKVSFAPSNEVERKVRSAVMEVGEPELYDQVLVLVRQALESPLFDRIRKARQVLREVPFSFRRDDAVFEGQIDLLIEESDGWVIIDYKTDKISEDAIQKRARVYAPQLELYREAFASITKSPVKDLLLFFIQPNVVVSAS